jgi:hypothetical protein
MITSARNAAAFCAALMMAACAQAPEANQQSASAAEEPIVIPDDQACEARPAIFVNPAVARQGATMDLIVQEPVGAFGPREIFPQLITGWTASPAGLVTIAKDGGSLTIAETAKPGVDVTLAMKYCDRPVSRTIRIVDKDEPVITGRWGQESITCTGETPQEPIRELIFKDTGDFSITYAPFESYTDFWGKTDVDIAGGTLALKVEGGNRVPTGGKFSGTMSLTQDDKLVLDGFFLSRPEQSGGSCRYVFGK